MYSWGSALGGARPPGCPPCLCRLSRGDRGALRPLPPLASSSAAGREAGRQHGKSQRRPASKAAESRARLAFIALGAAGRRPDVRLRRPDVRRGLRGRAAPSGELHPGGPGPARPAPPRRRPDRPAAPGPPRGAGWVPRPAGGGGPRRGDVGPRGAKGARRGRGGEGETREGRADGENRGCGAPAGGGGRGLSQPRVTS